MDNPKKSYERQIPSQKTRNKNKKNRNWCMNTKTILAFLLITALFLAGCIEEPAPPQPREEWLSYEPVQCQQNPWEIWHKGLNRQYFRQPTEEEILVDYFKTVHNIQILDTIKIPAPPDFVSCKACTCARGDTIKVLIKENDVSKMLELGWKRLETTGAIRLVTTKPYFINGETVQLKLENDSDKPIYFFRGLDGKTIEACGVANAVVLKKTNKFERFSHHKPIACMPAPSFEKLGPGQEALFEWKYPQIFRSTGEELPLLGEYKTIVSYSEQENGSQLKETESNEFLISKGLFVQYAWKSGDLTETITKLEDRVLLESARGKAMPQTFSIPLSESEQKEWQDALVGSGLFTVKQSDLKPNNFVQNNPKKTLRMRYNDLQANLQWKALEEEPPALAYAVNKLNETRKRFEQIATTENEWLSYSPIQCGNNPWEKWHNDLNRQYFRQPTEQEILTEYLQTVLNVDVVDYRHVPAMPGTVICEACNCARGDSIRVLANKSDSNKLLSKGWKKEFEIVPIASQDFSLTYRIASAFGRFTRKATVANQSILDEYVNDFNHALDKNTLTPLSASEWNSLVAYFADTGILDVQQAGLNDCTQIGTQCPTDGPMHFLEVRNQNQQTQLRWYYLLNDVPAINLVEEKIRELTEQ